MTYAVRPISDRSPFKGGSVESAFTVRWDQVEDLLDRELSLLRARNVVLEFDVLPADLRLDGSLRSGARATSPCVRLQFESEHGTLTYATDRFVRGALTRTRWNGRTEKDESFRVMAGDWQHNVYAIAKGLEALRMVDRYGIGGRQYAGYAQLGAGSGEAASHMTAADAEAVLMKVVGALDYSTGKERLRRARAMSHPDRHDGDRTLWDQVEQAATVLGLA